ncbi:hypothetical protein Brsp01_25470 [Brucella sp. NBRC 12950]|nr:hypothetical protein Brsp01_25470 [Brucella sp. NBRC 12950]
MTICTDTASFDKARAMREDEMLKTALSANSDNRNPACAHQRGFCAGRSKTIARAMKA